MLIIVREQNLKVIVLTLALQYVAPPSPVYAQEESEEKFTTIGPIGISDKYKLPENRNTIIFRIKNYTSRSIYKIYGRVFSINKEEKNLSKKFVLLNNPHQGGSIVKGNPHRPGTVSEWNFKLIRKPSKEAQDIKYTLQVNPRSIFFVNVEPPKIKEKKP